MAIVFPGSHAPHGNLHDGCVASCFNRYRFSLCSSSERSGFFVPARQRTEKEGQGASEDVARLSALLTKGFTKCVAWVLMSNHFHLLLKPTTVSLSETMRRLLTGYAVYFNRKYQRSGYLFQNRDKSILCEKEPYFLELVRYIHLNSQPGPYSVVLRCAHTVILGKKPAR